MNKNVLTAVAIFLSFIPAARGDSSEEEVPSLFRQANALYAQGRYTEAADEYRRILREGWESGPLYYNLANAYFKTGNLGRAILNYRKAWNLSPQDPEINKNLEYAREALRDDIAALPLSLWTRVKRAVILQFPIGVWIGISSAFYFLTVLWLIAVLMIKPLKKISPPVWKTLGFLLALSVIVSVVAYNYYHTPRAIILDPTATIRYGPKETDAAAFELHEGTEVRVVRKKDGWLQISLPDGKSGWLPAESLGII
ncbi:MAG: tetratricopeptide repeat protein [Candidatus Euphemobacter frigidus]|nr:tetratricopeptide repeat protein [Candidatus Euphemobacter frigidus]MDP8276340.1 tetratricopeptide repeat protein [Candidatus Euphemobacter frigidus]